MENDNKVILKEIRQDILELIEGINLLFQEATQIISKLNKKS